MSALNIFRNPWVISLVFLLLLYSGCSTIIKNEWKNSVPEGIKLGRVLTSTFDWIVPPGGSCGGAIIQLKDETALEIQKMGIEFFIPHQTPRNWENKTIAWTLGPSDNRGQISFQCALESSVEQKLYKQKLRDALTSKTSYYGVISGRSKARILIAPSQGLVFVGYWD